MPDYDETRVIHNVAIGNTLHPLGVTCKRPDGTVVDLTGLTAKFYAVNEDGTEAIAETTTGVTVTDADAGEVQYDFSGADVASAKRMYGYFNIYSSSEPERFPVKARDLTIVVHGDT